VYLFCDFLFSLPYCEATLREATRYETLVHTGLPHTVLDKDQEFMGYTLPKGTIMYPMLEHFHHDPELWDHPANFSPDRFLDNNGKLNLKNDVSLPFGAGKRVCVGENFARNTLFLVYTTILQNFNIRTPDGSVPDMSKRISGLITGPEDFWLKLDPR
jgi:cytochrome P450